MVLRKEYAIDSGGPGVNRGGAAVIKDTMWLREAEHWSSPMHTKRTSGVGVHGGKDGGTGAVWFFEPESFDVATKKDLIGLEREVYAKAVPISGVLDPETKHVDLENGEYFYFASSPVWQTKRGAVFRYLTNGGGGWGSPLEREPERVKNDVRDEYVSIEGAYRDYGVVITGDPVTDPEGLVIDHEATSRRRAELAASTAQG